MSEIDRKIKEIFSRVDIAASGQNNTDYWGDEEHNLSAPDGMDYWDWIEQATNDALFASKELVEQNKALKAALVLQSNATSEAMTQLSKPCNSIDNLGLIVTVEYAVASTRKALEQAK